MKLLHTSDWHLGKRLESFSRYDEQLAVLEEIGTIADNENVDAILVAGDLFDTFNPPTEAVELFYRSLKKLSKNGSRPVVAIAGNHDSPDRVESPDPLARECGIIFAGYPNSKVLPFELDSGLKVLKSTEGFLELRLPGKETPLRIVFTPYANEFRMKSFLGDENTEEELRNVLERQWNMLAEKHCDDRGVNILVSHLFMAKYGETLPDEPDDEKPILHVGGAQVVYSKNIPSQIQYTALGHLHRMHQVGAVANSVFYSGSPLSYSFAEASQEKYVLIIDVEPEGEAVVSPVKLDAGKPLLRKRAGGMDEALQWLTENKDALVELTLVSEKYLTANDRKQLNAAHSGLISIIPEVKVLAGETGSPAKNINLSRSMEELFADYFKHEHGQEPNEEILELFKEVLGR